MYTAELDVQASTGCEPVVVVSVDCPQPREIDDALFVRPLDSDREAFQVGVCVADTSAAYDDKEILGMALERRYARYYSGRRGKQQYVPMIGDEAVQAVQLIAGQPRSAMIVSFIVGDGLPPSDTQITFGMIEVHKNLNYRDFAYRVHDREQDQAYARAAAYLLHYLRFDTAAEREGSVPVSLPAFAPTEASLPISAQQAWRKGNRLNTTFMIAANHLGGRLLEAERHPVIYRRHDRSDGDQLDGVAGALGYFSLVAGHHDGLRLDPYPQLTSPLRRLQDFINMHSLRLRHEGQPVPARDIGIMTEGVDRLNARLNRRNVRHSLGEVCVADSNTMLALAALRRGEAVA